ESHEVGGVDRLDLGAQSIERVAMDAGQKPAGAPLGFRGSRGEPAAQDEPLGFEAQERRLELRYRQAAGGGEGASGHGSQTLETPADDLREGLGRVDVAGRLPGRGARIGERYYG